MSYVHPPGWQNPEPARRYDLVVIGGGTAGLVCAAGAAGLGARVALVERARLGGDCLNSGCVPSKTLLRSARAVHEARAGAAVGVSAAPVVDFDAVMRRVRERRADLAPNDSAERFTSLGVDVFFGDARFTDRAAVEVGAEVGGARLTFRRAVITTGSRPAVPDFPGLAGIPWFTSDTIFSLTAQPQSMLVVGGGAVGCELAQAFALLGTSVTLVEAGPRLLPHVDPDASAIVMRALERSGVRVMLGGSDVADLVTGVDAVLLATGRTPNVDGLGLAAAGVVTGEGGIEVDDRLRTANPRIFAAGDVCSPHRFTHAADAMARIVIQNALFFGRKAASDLIIPSCTYTFPEVAHVGADTGGVSGTEHVITIRLADVDRSVVDEETDGFIRIRHSRGTIAGATIVAPHAGELIGHVAHLMNSSGTLGDLSATVFPYPTVAEALRKAGDTYRRSALTPSARGLLGRYFSVLRR